MLSTMTGSDDLFSRLFELFNQPGPVNSKLASEVAHHLVGSAEPIDPWTSEEMRDLLRLAEFRLEGIPRPASVPSLELILVDQRAWVDRNIDSLQYLVEPLAGAVGPTGSAGPLAPFLSSLGPALAGIQLGSTMAAMAQTAFGHFDLPLPANGPLTLISTNLEQFADDRSLDRQQVRLWAVLSELANRLVWDAAWTKPHLSDLLASWMDDIKPEALVERLGQFSDPEELRSMIESGDQEELTAALEGDPAKREPIDILSAVLIALGQLLVTRAASDLLPSLEQIRSAWLAREDRVWPPGQTSERLSQAMTLIADVERRFGPSASGRLLDGPESLPTALELTDAVAWAARVLLDEML